MGVPGYSLTGKKQAITGKTPGSRERERVEWRPPTVLGMEVPKAPQDREGAHGTKPGCPRAGVPSVTVTERRR